MSGSGPRLGQMRPDEAGFAPDLGEKLEAGIRSGLLRDLHAVTVVRHAHTVLERYFAGPDEAWGKPLGNVSFGPDTLHDMTERKTVSMRWSALPTGIGTSSSDL